MLRAWPTAIGVLTFYEIRVRVRHARRVVLAWSIGELQANYIGVSCVGVSWGILLDVGVATAIG